MPTTDLELPLRIVLLAPPAGVNFALQHGATSGTAYPPVVDAQQGDGIRDLTFAFTIAVRREPATPLRLRGPFVQGPTDARFIYLVVGRRAGQPDSPWDRRAKVPLAGITPALVRAVLAHPGAWLEAAVPGTLPDGSPTCATRAFAPGRGWQARTARGPLAVA